MKAPLKRYRPVRTRSGGGFTTVLADSITIFGSFEIHREEIMVRGVPIDEDIEVTDIIEVPADQ